MAKSKRRFDIFKGSYLQVAGIPILILIALLLLWFNKSNSNQSIGAMAAKVRFEGEYSIDGGAWQPITEGQHISSTKGDVILKGNFHLYSPKFYGI